MSNQLDFNFFFFTKKPLFLFLLFHPVLIFLPKALGQVYKSAMYILLRRFSVAFLSPYLEKGVAPYF